MSSPSSVRLGPLRDMFDLWLLAALTTAAAAALLAWYCKEPNKDPEPEDKDNEDRDPPYLLRTRPTRPALDYATYHRY